MTPTLVFAVLIMAGCLLALRRVYGRNWLLRPFTWLMWSALIYHGLSEVIIRLTHADELVTFRVERNYVDLGALFASFGMLAMTVTYCLVSRPPEVDTEVDLSQVRRQFDWRLLAIPTIPMVLIALTVTPAARVAQFGSISAIGLAGEFVIPFLILAAFGFLLKTPRFFVVIVAMPSLLLALIGQRLEVVMAAVCVWILAARVGIRPSRPQTLAIASVAILLMVSITSVRATEGRSVFSGDSTAAQRAEALVSGIANPTADSIAGGSVLQEAALRLDSNTWAGSITRSFAQGYEPVGLGPIRTAVLIAIPSGVYKEKGTALAGSQGDVELSQIEGLGMPLMDYLPGHITSFMGALGVQGMIILNLLVGVLLGVLDKAALRSVTPLRILTLAFLALAAMRFERGLDFYLMVGRGYLVMAFMLWVALAVWNRIKPLITLAPNPVDTQLTHRSSSMADKRRA